MKKIALYFGSFNPIHKAHVEIAKYMVAETEVEELWFVVSPQNPFKTQDDLLDETIRLKMVKIACEDYTNINASNVEFSLKRPSYTIDTLNHLKDQYPNYCFSLLMGEDNIVDIELWKDYKNILDHYKIYYYPRKDSKNEYTHRNIIKLNSNLLNISSTMIRELIISNKDCSKMLENAVWEYIKSKKLYKKS
jgi:nicotinate-nucleotide adenylyltransferase